MFHDVKFEAGDISLRVNTLIAELSKLLLEIDIEGVEDIQQRLSRDINAHRKSAYLTIAFVGQYNSGKSTIISALTGRRDIYIDSNIATDITFEYDWNGIKLVDTPGLFTDRNDHDDITYEAIKRADLLVFCLTGMLFDDITAPNFKKLAYEQDYRWKMMLLVNKISDEAGDDNEKITYYKESLAEALHPEPLNEFSLSFINAKDYYEGIDKNDELLKQISYFEEFIEILNKMIRDKGVLAKLDREHLN